MRQWNAIAAPMAFIAAAAASGVHAQQAGRTHRIGLIAPSTSAAVLADPANPQRRQLLQALQERGYVEGRNLVIDRRTADGDLERIPALVADLVRLKTEVIIVPHIGIAQTAAQVTSATPIVSMSGDPTRVRMVKNLNRPGGNVTGFVAAGITSVEQKRLELLRELVPNIRRVAFVAGKGWWDEWMAKAMNDAASALGLKVLYVEGKANGFGDAFAAVKREKPDAVFFEASPVAVGFRSAIGEFALSSGIPSACGHRELVEAGCLMAYNFTSEEVYRGIARYVDLILKGTKPGDLPFEQYSKYEFAVNRKTAQAIGLKLPQAALLRADRVIE